MRTKHKILFQDLHHTKAFRKKFISSLSEPIDRIVICSPFFDKLPSPFDNILQFCMMQFRRGTNTIQIITRPPGADTTAMSIETAKQLSSAGVDIYVRTTPYLHAKIYHFDYTKGYFRSFVGSANFTMGGFERNFELVTEVEGAGMESPYHREIARMQDKGALPYNVWVSHAQPKEQPEAI